MPATVEIGANIINNKFVRCSLSFFKILSSFKILFFLFSKGITLIC